MSPSFIADAVTKLTEAYGAEHTNVANDNGRTLVRIDEVELYEGCQPRSTPLLVVLDPGQPKPSVYVRPGQLLSNGKAPRSTSVVMVGGESWMQFSFNIPWEERFGIVRYIAAARQRFAQND